MAPLFPSNVSKIGCPTNALYGYGLQISFSWTDGNAPGVAGYEIFVKHSGSINPLLDVSVQSTQCVYTSCNATVADPNLKDWQWRVRAKDASSNFGDWSGTRTCQFAPCRSLTVEFAGTPLLRFRVRVGSRDQKWANIGYVLLCLRSHPLMRRSQPNEQTDLTLQERADCGRSAGRDSWEVMKWKEPLAQIPRRHQVSDTVIHKWRERFYVNWGGPSPSGRGRGEAPGDGRKSFQILRPSPWPSPRGRGWIFRNYT